MENLQNIAALIEIACEHCPPKTAQMIMAQTQRNITELEKALTSIPQEEKK